MLRRESIFHGMPIADFSLFLMPATTRTTL